MTPTFCPICRTSEYRDVTMTSGPHFAKRVCRAGHFMAWLPHPKTRCEDMPAELLPLVVKRARPVSLRGSDRQVGAARSIRANMIHFALKTGQDDFAWLMSCVNDATWFLANKGLYPPALKCWPRVDQMEPVKEEVKA